MKIYFTNWIKSIFKSDFFKKFAKVFSIDVLVRASGIILLPIYLRLMTQSEYGLFTYLNSIILTFATFLNFGIYIAQVKLYHEYKLKNREGELLYTINIILLLFLCVVLIPSYFLQLDYTFIAFLFNNKIDYTSYRNFIYATIIVSVYSFMLFNYLYTCEKIKQIQIYNILRLVLINIFCISVLYYLKIDSVKIRIAIGCIIEIAIMVFFMRDYLRKMTPRFNFTIAKRAFKLSFPTFLSLLFGVFCAFSDRFFLEKNYNFADMAIYNLSLTISNILSMIYNSLQNIWLPKLFKETDPIKAYENTKRLSKNILLIFFVLSVALIISFYIAIMMNLIEIKYKNVLLILPILLLSQIIQTVSSLFQNFFAYFEKLFIGMVLGIVVYIIGIIMNGILITNFGMLGAALSLVFISIIMLVAAFSFTKIHLRKATKFKVNK